MTTTTRTLELRKVRADLAALINETHIDFSSKLLAYFQLTQLIRMLEK